MHFGILCGVFLCISLLFYNFTPVDVISIGNLSALNHFSPERFGTYFILTKSLESCTPSRPLDKQHFLQSNMYVTKISRTQEEYKGYVYAPADVVVTEGYISCGLTNGRTTTQLFRKTFKNTCDEYFFKVLVDLFLELDTATCTIKQNNYTVSNVDMNKLVHILVGEHFVHETVGFRFEVFSRAGAVYCLEVFFESKPLKQKKLGGKKKTTNTTSASG